MESIPALPLGGTGYQPVAVAIGNLPDTPPFPEDVRRNPCHPCLPVRLP